MLFLEKDKGKFIWSDSDLGFLDGRIRSFLEGRIWIRVKPSRIRNPDLQVWNAMNGELCCSYEDGRRVPINIIRNSIIQ